MYLYLIRHSFLSAFGRRTLVLLTFRERIKNAADLNTPSSGTRVRLWQTSWRMIKDHPLLGVGLDNFKRFFNQYKVP